MSIITFHMVMQPRNLVSGKKFMYLHGLSGSSSAQFLQNVVISKDNQKAALCQAVCEMALDITCKNDFNNRGASRIHGGGFGGCIQVFLPAAQLQSFINIVNKAYNKQVATEIKFSNTGAHTK